MPDALPADAVRSIRRTLNAILRKTSAVNAEVAYLFDLLDTADAPPTTGALDVAPLAVARGGSNGRAVAPPPPPAEPSGVEPSGVDPSAADLGAPGLPKRYEVREMDGAARLLEWRDDATAPGGGPAAPFAVPRATYAAFAAAVAERSGRKFDVIFRRAAHALGENARDYQCRVCLRFWQSRGLVARDRGRYSVAGPKDTFAARAEAAWDLLLSPGVGGEAG